MSSKKEATGAFVGFQQDFVGNMVIRRADKKLGSGVLKYSKSRIETAARAFLEGTVVSDPRDVVLPPAISSTAGIVGHGIILATEIWHKIRPRDHHNYEQAYQHNVAVLAPNLMPNVSDDTARQILSVLARRVCAMPYTTDEYHRTERRTVYGLIARGIIQIAKEKPPFTAGLRLDDALFTSPGPRKFSEAWERQEGDKRLASTVNNIFADREANPFKYKDFNTGTLLVSAGELRAQTWIPQLGGPYSVRYDRLFIGGQDPGEKGRPQKAITAYEYKTSAKEVDFIPVATEACDFIAGQIAAGIKRIVPTKRTVLVVEDALINFHGKTAYMTEYRGYGTNPAWQKTTGDLDHLHVATPGEMWEKTDALVKMVRLIQNERPDLISLFR